MIRTHRNFNWPMPVCGRLPTTGVSRRNSLVSSLLTRLVSDCIERRRLSNVNAVSAALLPPEASPTLCNQCAQIHSLSEGDEVHFGNPQPNCQLCQMIENLFPSGLKLFQRQGSSLNLQSGDSSSTGLTIVAGPGQYYRITYMASLARRDD